MSLQAASSLPVASQRNYPAGDMALAEDTDLGVPAFNPSQPHEDLRGQQGYDQPTSYAADDVHSWEDDQDYFY